MPAAGRGWFAAGRCERRAPCNPSFLTSALVTQATILLKLAASVFGRFSVRREYACRTRITLRSKSTSLQRSPRSSPSRSPLARATFPSSQARRPHCYSSQRAHSRVAASPTTSSCFRPSAEPPLTARTSTTPCGRRRCSGRGLASGSSTRIGSKGGRNRYRFHDLRHTAVSRLVAEGADVKLVQAVAGHSKSSLTLDRYTHLTDERVSEAAKRFDPARKR